jgi:hypothetical protein
MRILIFVTIGVVIGFFYFRDTQSSYRPSKSESEIAHEMSRKNPDAEVFDLEEDPPKSVKKK